MQENDFWFDKENAQNIIAKTNKLREVIDPVTELAKRIENNITTISSLTEDDSELSILIESEYLEDIKSLEELKLQTFLSGKYDGNDCILEIHAGAGGTEACDWASMLYRMYVRYFSKKGYKVEELDRQNGEEVGIKSVMIKVFGKNTYGYLKHEKGVHRLVRISPFDAGKRRHTSFASVEVLPQIEDDIKVEINENDLKIDIYRSSGPGGQGVNTTDSAVRITHIPTGIVVTCQNERSQIQNKQHCMDVLKSKLYNLELEKKAEVLNEMKNGKMQVAFGSGKRSYVMCPYTLVKDNESGYETGNVNGVLDGDLDEIIKSYFKGVI